MRFIFTPFIAAFSVIVSLLGPAGAQERNLERKLERVQFPTATSPPAALQKRMAAMRGEDAKGGAALMLRGYIRRPAKGPVIGPAKSQEKGPGKRNGPFPSLVLLHTCQGITGAIEDWADQLADWGYLTLLVDSYGPRHHRPDCNSYERMESVDQTFDATGALKYLRRRADVKEGPIGLIGWSIGGSKVLSALNQIGIHNLYQDKFAYGVAFYPYCLTASGPFIGPLLMLIGGRDDWTTARRCKTLRDANAGTAQPLDLQIYPTAYHFFDDPDIGPARYRREVENREKNPARGVTWGYNPAAHNAAQDAVRQFLERQLRGD